MTFDPGKNLTFKGNTCFLAQELPDILEIVIAAPSVPFWARGESKEYEFPCQPTIVRTDHRYLDKRLYNPDGSLTVGEFDAIKQCHLDFQSGKILDELFARFIDTSKKKIDPLEKELLYWASLAQHYNENQIYPTRLLDVTSDMLVATYFACNSNPDEDGYVFYGDFANNNLSMRGAVTTIGSFFDITEIEDLENPNDPYHPMEDTLNLAPLPYSNKRMTAQRGALVWSRQPDNTYFNEIRQFIIKIPSESKDDFLVGLDRFGYNESSMFPPEISFKSSMAQT